MGDTTKRLLLAGALAALGLLGSAAASAQISAQQASQSYKQGVKLEANAARFAIRAAAQDASAAIQNLTSQVASPSFSIQDLLVLDATLREFQADVVGALALFTLGSAGLTKDLLDDFAGGGMLMGIYPSGFYHGDGGPLDAAHRAVDEEIDKAVAKVEKKLAGLAKRLEQAAGIGFASDVRLPLRRLEWYVNHPALSSSMGNELFLAYVYAYSHLANADDGRLCAGGLAPNNSSVIEIEARGGYPNGTIADSTTGVSPVPDWQHCLAAVPEGNYLLQVGIQGEGSLQSLAIGVR
jgi:hypothetical protein